MSKRESDTGLRYELVEVNWNSTISYEREVDT